MSKYNIFGFSNYVSVFEYLLKEINDNNNKLIPDLSNEIGIAPVDTPEPEAQSVKEVPNIISRPNLPSHAGCRCEKRLTIVPSDKAYQLVRWDADSACEICQQQAKIFNAQMQRSYQMLNSNE